MSIGILESGVQYVCTTRRSVASVHQKSDLRNAVDTQNLFASKPVLVQFGWVNPDR